MLQHQLRNDLLSMIIVKENLNNCFAINMCVVIYVLCQQAKPYVSNHVHYIMHSVFARIERGQCADLGKGHFCARSIILRELLRVILHFEGTMGKITYLLT